MIEVGCGLGKNLFETLCMDFSNMKAIGIDINRESMKTAGTGAKALGMHESMSFY